jgi:hypothetical protein
VLGYARADDAAPYRLYREACPVQHPRYPWLWADAVSEIHRIPLPTTQTDGTKKAKEASVGYQGYAPDYTTNYGLVEITVRFRNMLWRQFTDADSVWVDNYLGKEWLRSFGCVGKTVQLDLISAEGASDASALYFAEGDAGDGPVSGPDGTPFGGTQFTRAQRTDFKLLWKCVPVNYTCGPIDNVDEDNIASLIMPFPERLVRALGTVNKTAFPGANSPYKAGTLLLKAIEETPYQLPVRTNSDFGLLCADYTFTFEYFNPPRDPAAIQNYSGVGPPAVVYGHNLFPYRPAGRYWYLATSGSASTRGTYSGNQLIEATEFHDMFQHRSNTSDYPLP